MNNQHTLHEPFEIEKHKKNFINYLEVIILEDGTIEYAIPSHQEKMIQIASQKLGKTREELFELSWKEYRFDVMEWLCEITFCIAVWNESFKGNPSEQQRNALLQLKKEGIYQGLL